MNSDMNVIAIFTFKELKLKLKSKYLEIELSSGTYRVNCRTDSLKCLLRSQTCVTCSKVGNILKLYSQNLLPGHINCYIPNCYWCCYNKQKIKMNGFLLLFHKTKTGKEILMTRDHIIPVSRGGTNQPTNSQTMCENCNQWKADKLLNQQSTLTYSLQEKIYT